MSKFLLNLLGQISKAFVYSKIQILFGNNSPQLSAQPRPILFFSTDRFSLPFPLGLSLPAGLAHHHGPTSRRLLRPAPQPSMAPPPAGLVPPTRSPRRLHRKRKRHASNSPSFPLINRRHFPPLQSRKPAPSTPPLKLIQAGN
jgi:hypothetical protein